jgi:hypothetical protein
MSEKMKIKSWLEDHASGLLFSQREYLWKRRDGLIEMESFACGVIMTAIVGALIIAAYLCFTHYGG